MAGRKCFFFAVFGELEDDAKVRKACDTDAQILNSISNEWNVFKWRKNHLFCKIG